MRAEALKAHRSMAAIGVWSDGSLAGLSAIIEKGVAHPVRYQGVMPPLGGAPLSKKDLAAVSAYVWAVNHSSNN
jgi:hypothetical protein